MNREIPLQRFVVNQELELRLAYFMIFGCFGLCLLIFIDSPATFFFPEFDEIFDSFAKKYILFCGGSFFLLWLLIKIAANNHRLHGKLEGVHVDSDGIWKAHLSKKAGLIPWSNIWRIKNEGDWLRLFDVNNKKLVAISHYVESFESLYAIVLKQVKITQKTVNKEERYFISCFTLFSNALGISISLLLFFYVLIEGFTVDFYGNGPLGRFIASIMTENQLNALVSFYCKTAMAILTIKLVYDSFFQTIYACKITNDKLILYYHFRVYIIDYYDIKKIAIDGVNVLLYLNGKDKPTQLCFSNIDESELYNKLVNKIETCTNRTIDREVNITFNFGFGKYVSQKTLE